MVDVSKAIRIPGWTQEKELVWLAEQASKCTCILEIGSWMGRSTVAMAANTKGLVVAIDTWKGTFEDGHHTLLEGQPDTWLYDQFLKEIQGLGNIVPVQGKSTEVGRQWLSPVFDMIFIDGDHSYEAVKADIETWRPLLAPGGLFCGHDWDRGQPGTVRAVRETVKNPRYSGAGMIWYDGNFGDIKFDYSKYVKTAAPDAGVPTRTK
jgi:predicted O-methyltransferase YrrM